MLMRHLAGRRLNGDWNRTKAEERETKNWSSSPVTFLTWLPGSNVHAFACVFVYVCEVALEKGGGYSQSN